MASRTLATAALVAVGVFGYFSILGLAAQNGFFATLDALAAADAEAGVAPARLTGLAPCDAFLQTLLRFFTPCVTGELPALSLFSAFAAVQVLPLHSVVVLEGLRAANAGTVFAFSAVWGTIYQTIPFGVVLPLYFALYLWRSPLAFLSASTTVASQAEKLSMDPVKVRAVTGALTLGYVFFPAQVAAWQLVLGAVVSRLALVNDSAGATPVARLRYSRRVFPYILGIAAALHLAIVSAVAVPWLRSGVIPVDLQAAFVPMPVSAPRPIAALAEGSLNLLQYDLYCASGAALLLVSYLTLVVGPGGAVLWALWDRDEVAYAAAADIKKKA
ncbi:hypothetical protein B0T26DRAFT_681671 [Lasiosphaeria miniovina]|uniref:Uncharacterized protein n=1 Tax=Lasiosphaeria miniovina TaxID=1954250 RepID=A0AA40DKF0_9PEZI|nr:uncharacterized protein B0T26DRAFT_681671 [Lasiosphaeria miniovina]KAK0704062.1 hypothetical protein B0T26DRAFT_681671 [Lasiosphaeria miniovina]